MLVVPYTEHAASFSPEIVALVDDDSIYSYNLPLLSLLSLIACMARDILDDSVVERTNDIPLKSTSCVVLTHRRSGICRQSR